MSRKLRIFLCHATEDRPATRELYKKLAAETWIQPWMDTEDLLPGQDFDLEIYKALRDSDAILICMSQVSVSKSGYLNKEIRRTLDIADEKPEGTIYIIPVKFDECVSSFEKLNRYQWVNYYEPGAHERLLKSLRMRAEVLKIAIVENRIPVSNPEPITNDDLDLYRFIEIAVQKKSKIKYPFWIAKYPITNAQYERFLKASDYSNPLYWLEFPKYDRNCQSIGDWGKTGLDWLRDELKKANTKNLMPLYWDHKDLGRLNPNSPVVGISWYEANAYAEWLCQNWETLPENEANRLMKPRVIRLPLETEWSIAAGGEWPKGRYPWDEPGKATTSLKEILYRTNVADSGVGHTTPVNAYPFGKSLFGVMDLAGNVWEWQVNYSGHEYDGQKALGLRGGSWSLNQDFACVSRYIKGSLPITQWPDLGFRVVVLPSEDAKI